MARKAKAKSSGGSSSNGGCITSLFDTSNTGCCLAEVIGCSGFLAVVVFACVALSLAWR